MELRDIKTGMRVKHLPSRSNPKYHEYIGIGTVVTVSASRVRVKWDNVRKERNYKPECLEVAA